MAIPKILHRCWFNDGPLPPLQQRCLDSWKTFAPDWTIMDWTADNFPPELTVARTFLNRKLYAFASDYVRLYAVLNHGGIYMDSDIELVRPIDDLCDNVQFLGQELEGRINNVVCGGVPGAPFFRACIEAMDRHYAQSDILLLSPEFCTRVALAHTFPDLHIYPVHAFYPYNPYDPAQQVKQLMYADIRPDTYAVHHWAKGWKLPLLTKGKRWMSRHGGFWRVLKNSRSLFLAARK